MAAHDADITSISDLKASSPSGAKTHQRRCLRRECHEVSLSVFPRERQAETGLDS